MIQVLSLAKLTQVHPYTLLANPAIYFHIPEYIKSLSINEIL